jgi:hypothetical protein
MQAHTIVAIIQPVKVGMGRERGEGGTKLRVPLVVLGEYMVCEQNAPYSLYASIVRNYMHLWYYMLNCSEVCICYSFLFKIACRFDFFKYIIFVIHLHMVMFIHI